jgi:hypothetical protein
MVVKYGANNKVRVEGAQGAKKIIVEYGVVTKVEGAPWSQGQAWYIQQSTCHRMKQGERNATKIIAE